MKLRHFKRRQTTQRHIWTFVFGKKECSFLGLELRIRKRPVCLLGVLHVF